MISVYTYICLSFLSLILFFLDYAYAYREYFTTVVELTNSPAFRLVCVNGFVASTILLWRVSRKVFFGTLNPEENDMVNRKLPFYVMECLVVPFYFESTIFNRVGVISLLTVVFGMLHRVAQERVTTLHITEVPAVRKRMLWGLALFFLVAMPLDVYVVFDLLVNTSWQYERQVGLYYTIALLYTQFAISSVRIVVRILFSEVIGVANHSGLAFYVESFFSISKSIVIFATFAYVSTVAQVPIPLVRLLVHHVISFCDKIRRLIRYWSLMRLLHSIRNATEEDIARDPRCSICHDDMTPTQDCKCLPCMHCYHQSCLRPWFEKMSTCPCCRTDLLRTSTNTTRTANTPATPQPREGHAGANPQVFTAQEQWHPPNEEEMRRSYEQYREAFGVGRQRREVRTTSAEPLSQQQQQQQPRVHIVGVGTHRTYVVSREEAAALGAAAAAAAARVALPPSARGLVEGRNLGIATTATTTTCTDESRTLQQPGSRDLQRLEAYKAYEEAVRAATDLLHQRLQAIDIATNENNAAT
ncbi:uncharacterized protein TM35_000182620 [Trypanosoma theileri]|uniref:RING-type domain-containing protein n=1 Tax=Trypanosoma theileri TaxID=67003 RepID=A0A1X0NU29_9TRYP|nr:uncharacterized protein TM35_000182620 [Trypanosoma theileri]ORC88205.1 hypothetical protein TM35_000182620 [Trypanosoma theileri]